jgi:hypothetical protein
MLARLFHHLLTGNRTPQGNHGMTAERKASVEGDIESRKAEVLRLIDAAGTDGKYDEEHFDLLMEALKALCALTPLPAPLDEQEYVAGPWKTLFASFGPRHTAGKTLVHDTLLSFQSFNKFPKIPVKVVALEQEIHAGTKEYNNISYLENADGTARASIIVRGHYDDSSENRERYDVTFSRVELVSDEGLEDAALREAFGLEADSPLAYDLKANFHSDVSFCDDSMRVNYGGMGGVYVLERLHHSGRSVSFD